MVCGVSSVTFKGRLFQIAKLKSYIPDSKKDFFSGIINPEDNKQHCPSKIRFFKQALETWHLSFPDRCLPGQERLSLDNVKQREPTCGSKHRCIPLNPFSWCFHTSAALLLKINNSISTILRWDTDDSCSLNAKQTCKEPMPKTENPSLVCMCRKALSILCHHPTVCHP